MDEKRLIENTLARLNGSYKFGDDVEFGRAVRERASNMESKNEKVRYANAYEAPRIERRARVFNAVAGTAAAAGLLGAAVFGLVWLNEHGGLKEGGIEVEGTGAAYHSVAETEQPEQSSSEDDIPDITEEPNDALTVITTAPLPEVTGISEVTSAIVPSHEGFYEGESALAILMMYAGNDYHYPLGEMKIEDVNYRTHDSWTGGIHSGDYKFNIAAVEGEPLYAVTSGTVIETNTEYTPGYNEGIFVAIKAADGRKWQYNHLSDIYVNVGDSVSAGDNIAAIGSTGWCTGPLVSISFPDSEVIDPELFEGAPREKSASIRIDCSRADIWGEYEFLYYIDNELQKDLTETMGLSGMKEFRWDVSGSGVHTYMVLVRNPKTRYYEIMFNVSIDFTQSEPKKTFMGEFNSKIFKNVAEKQVGDLSLIQGIYAPGENPFEYGEPDETAVTGTEETETAPEDTFTLPESVGDNNDFYGEYLDTPLVGDEAWELVKERGGIDFDFPLPYDKSLFVFDGCEFYINYADCDVTALVGGTVEFTGWYYGWGNSVLMRDDNGHYWFWGHLSEVSVEEGDTVEAGARIGHTGSSGYAIVQHYALRVG